MNGISLDEYQRTERMAAGAEARTGSSCTPSSRRSSWRGSSC